MSGWEYDFTVRQVADWRDPEYVAARDAFVAARPEGAFGFALDPDRPLPPKVDRWEVSLPHQCDAWTIADGSDHAVAVEELRVFIAKAQAALDALLRREEATD